MAMGPWLAAFLSKIRKVLQHFMEYFYNGKNVGIDQYNVVLHHCFTTCMDSNEDVFDVVKKKPLQKDFISLFISHTVLRLVSHNWPFSYLTSTFWSKQNIPKFQRSYRKYTYRQKMTECTGKIAILNTTIKPSIAKRSKILSQSSRPIKTS